MSADPYSPDVRRLFAGPAHAGDLDGAVRVRHDDQGIRLQLDATSRDGVLTALRFRAWGCPHLIAAAEAACAALEGQPAAALLEFTASDLMENLHIPVVKSGRILVLEDALRLLGQRLRDGS